MTLLTWGAIALIKPLAAALLMQGLAMPDTAARGARPRITAVDSLRLDHRARSAQSEFEVFHRANLPREPGGGDAGPCDVRIGRLCYWSEDDTDSTVVPERPLVTRARWRLLQMLDSVGALIPGDPWVAGQRVRYLVDASEPDSAFAAATECRADPAWCTALVAYALDAAGRARQADSVYTLALALMPDAQRCAWLDVSMLLPDDLARRYQHGSCAGRDSLAERFWWLGTPLFLAEANTLRTEHLARMTRVRMEEDARSTQDMPWGDDLRELTLRYGWCTWFTSTPPPYGSDARPSVVGHDPTPNFSFFPRTAAVDSPFTIDGSSYDFHDREATTRYAPAYLKALHPLESQIAAFRRGDSVLIAGIGSVAGDTALVGQQLRWGLFLSDRPGRVASRVASDRAARVVFTVSAPWDSMLVSLEALAEQKHVAARARRGARVPPASHGLALSDLLLYAPGGSTPRRLEDALPDALSTETVTGRTVGLYWETYGLPPQGQPLDVVLTVERTGDGWLHRAFEQLHLARRATPLHVRWEEVPGPQDGIASRAVAIDLSRMAPGRYRVQLQVTAPNEQTVTSAREIQLAP